MKIRKNLKLKLKRKMIKKKNYMIKNKKLKRKLQLMNKILF